MGNTNQKALPIDTIFKLPSPIPSWPPGEGFASGTIDLGGLQVSQVSTFNKIWSTYKGGPNDQGATFFEPSSIPYGFFMLGSYSQSNNNPLFGWVLVGKDVTNNPSNGTLSKPIDYTLVWSSKSSKKLNQNVPGYIWLPTPLEGYKSVGHVVTTSPEKPSLDKVRCVRADFTEKCDTSKWIWGKGKESDTDEFNVYGLRPRNVGVRGQGVGVGTFIALNSGDENSNLSLFCLKNNKDFFFSLSAMPNFSQAKAIIQAYSPLLYFHPRETYLPSSVNWNFANRVESNPIPFEPNGSKFPQDGSNGKASEEVKKGNLQSEETYFHVKPILGGTFSDIQIWTFYRFNDLDISLSRTGEHVGDWEHVTLRVSNFDGVLYCVYLAKHNGGVWIDSPLLEFTNGSNKFMAYASLHGHASYPSPELEAQGTFVAGLRNDTAKSSMFIDTGAKYSIVAGKKDVEIVQQLWLKYARKWGLKKTYESGEDSGVGGTDEHGSGEENEMDMNANN